MPIRFPLLLGLLLLLVLAAAAPAQDTDDPFLWLEEVQGQKALDWVKKKNAATQAEYADTPVFREIYDQVFALVTAKDRLATGTQYGAHVYGFWRSADKPRGIYRRAPLASFLTGKPKWETLLDIDALAKAENKKWVFKGMTLRYPDYKRGLVRLSPGGSDAVVIREFDVESKSFVKGGFSLPEAKGGLGWIDADTVYVRTNFGPGSLTDSGYPRIVKIWERGTPLSEAKTVLEAHKRSVSASASRSHFPDRTIDWLYESSSFYASQKWVRTGDELTRLGLPGSARIHTYFDGLLFVELKQQAEFWGKVYAQGSVVTIPLDELLDGKRGFTLFFEPTERTSFRSLDRTKSCLLMQVLEDVRDRFFVYRRKDGKWERRELKLGGTGRIQASSVSAHRDNFFVTYRSFLRPSTLFHVDATTLASKVIQQAPARFDSSPYEASQHFATSKDGTKIPYFLVKAKSMKLDGRNKTMLYAYGGFRIAQRPRYLSALGKAWLDRGGVYVLANIRGGGEYGPRWHAAALREKRHKCFEDFEAIAEDLIARKITSPSYLGIQGGSNGGLLVGAAFTRRPDLYGAVVCSVPLLDMKRYHKLLAGASWVAEYGNPDKPEDWAFLRKYSPYHNLKKDKKYPRVLFYTSTKDDRVHPGHARKMVARMESMGHPVLYYENIEGGHAGASTPKQTAFRYALIMAYLNTELGKSMQ